MIAITEEKKKEFEAKIADLERERAEHEKVGIGMFDSIWAAKTTQTIDLLREILSEAVTIPIVKRWGHVITKGEDAVDTENWDLTRQALHKLEELYERIEIENDLDDSYEE